MTEILYFSQIDPDVLQMKKVRGIFLEMFRMSDNPAEKEAIKEMLYDALDHEGVLMNRAQARQIVAELNGFRNPEICKN